MHISRPLVAWSLLALVLVSFGCSTSGDTVDAGHDWLFGDTADHQGSDARYDVRLDDGLDQKSDTDLPDGTGSDSDAVLEPGGLNWPCVSDGDCNSKYCLSLGDHSVCTVMCPEGTCPSDWMCKSVIDSFPTPEQICVPDMGKRCAACELDTDCAPQGDRCLPFGEGLGEGLWCFQDCSVGGNCPASYTCEEVKDAVSGLFKGRFCVPDNDSCYCSPEMELTTQECVRKNQWGECKGHQICMGNLGWVDCSAPLPSVEYCNQVDDDCDGDTDEEYSLALADGTKFAMGAPCDIGACTGGTVVCKNLSEAMCSAVTQGKTEQCNGLDDDCDGVTDEYVIKTFYKDLDGDGHAVVNDDTTTGCEAPAGYSEFTDDCNEGDAEVAGGLPELCDYKDNNCNEAVDEGLIFALPDHLPVPIGGACGDGICGDGIVVCKDKNTLTCSSFVNAIPEICNNTDDDCDGVLDNGCDDDEDAYCDANMQVVGKPSTCMLTGLDCDDNDKLIHPNRPEYCNGKDDNCDGSIDVDVLDCASNSCTGSGNAFIETFNAQCLNGGCEAPGAIGCGNYMCEDGGGAGKHCLQACLYDPQCIPNAHCDEITGTCVLDVPNSGGCSQNSDCASNYCYNGFCCESGFCCSGPQDCPSQFWAAPTCQFPPACQGIRYDAQCVDGKCQMGDGIPDDTGCNSSHKAKDCGAYTPMYCNGKLDQSEPLCPSWCQADLACQEGFHCDQVCVLDLADGAFCDEASDCASQHCQNGHCCATGDCCAQAGDCNALTYAEPSTCNDTANCQGTRRDPLCVGSMCVKSDLINDDSGCLLMVADTCGAYTNVVCSANIAQIKPPCQTQCISNSQCDVDAHCEYGTCLSDVNAGAPCGTTMECSDGLFCVDGVCCDSQCIGFCRSCKVPGFEGTCLNIPPGQDPDSECGDVDCSAFFFGWEGNDCLARMDASAEQNTCSGTGQCTPVAQICSSMGPGPVAKSCSGQCETPNPDTCSGQQVALCQAGDTGPVTCGKGACAVTVEDGCIDGVPVFCQPGPAGEETCNNIDDDCDGVLDDGVPGGEDILEPNDLCSQARDLGEVLEGGPTGSWTATIYPIGDVDYYKIYANEAEHVCVPLFGQNYTLEIKVVPPQGANCRDYDLYVYDDACNLLKASAAASCYSDTVKYEWGGTCAGEDSITVRVKVVPWMSANDCFPYTLTVRMY